MLILNRTEIFFWLHLIPLHAINRKPADLIHSFVSQYSTLYQQIMKEQIVLASIYTFIYIKIYIGTKKNYHYIHVKFIGIERYVYDSILCSSLFLSDRTHTYTHTHIHFSFRSISFLVIFSHSFAPKCILSRLFHHLSPSLALFFFL